MTRPFYRQTERPYYKVILDEPKPLTPIECGCGWKGNYMQVGEIDECSLTPGDPSPCGRCPECDGLVYVPERSDAI